MSRIESLESQVRELTTDELRLFRAWFAAFDAEAWDQQIESDLLNGKLDGMAKRALRDHQAGKTSQL